MRKWLLAGALAGCGARAEPPKQPAHEEQSYAQAISLICEVDAHSGADPDDVLAVSARREEYLIERVKNSDGIYFLTLFRIEGPAEQASMLEQEARSEKVADCALVRALRADAGQN